MRCILLLLPFISLVYGHGYMSSPIGRQHYCFRAGGFWWPADGSGIADDMCRASYQHVYKKVLLETGDEARAATEAQTMFQQTNEYAALAGQNYEDLQHIVNNVVPTGLCSAGAVHYTDQFGDKSGMSISGNWYQNEFHIDKHENSVFVNLEFCATAAHEPSYFEVYVTEPGFDYIRDVVSWHNLELIDRLEVSVSRPISTTCQTSGAYILPVSVPYRRDGVLYVRWQRYDPVGEGFYNCVDFKMTIDNPSDDDDIIGSNDDDDDKQCNKPVEEDNCVKKTDVASLYSLPVIDKYTTHRNGFHHTHSKQQKKSY